MNYIDGFVTPVSAANKAAFIQHSKDMGALLKEFGALSVVDCWGDDVPEGKITSFPMAVKLEPGEVVVFSWIEWPNKAARDEGMQRAMTDPRMTAASMPFDGKRLIYGGFQIVAKS
jgi:uncharacterized protein YbaA (DUF1428 family)